jgi:hypothetical protein
MTIQLSNKDITYQVAYLRIGDKIVLLMIMKFPNMELKLLLPIMHLLIVLHFVLD